MTAATEQQTPAPTVADIDARIETLKAQHAKVQAEIEALDKEEAQALKAEALGGPPWAGRGAWVKKKNTAFDLSLDLHRKVSLLEALRGEAERESWMALAGEKEAEMRRLGQQISELDRTARDGAAQASTALDELMRLAHQQEQILRHWTKLVMMCHPKGREHAPVPDPPRDCIRTIPLAVNQLREQLVRQISR